MPMTKKELSSLKRLSDTLRKSGIPRLRNMAAHARGGMEIVNSLFAAHDAIGKIKLPKGIKVESITFANINGKREGDLEFATWVLEEVLPAQMTIEENALRADTPAV
jgi:hypothetical protein